MRKYFLNLLLLVAALPGFSQSVITYPASGNVATEEWVQNYLFDQLEKYNISDCDLKISSIVQDGSAIELGLSSSIQGLNNYSIRIVKNDKSWFWNAVPYQTGETMRIEGVPQLDSVRITIRPTARPTCYVGFNYNLGGGDNPDPTDPTDPTDPVDPTQPLPNCSAGPTILTIVNPTQTGLTATFHGNGVTQIGWWITNASTPNIKLRTGQITPTSSTVNLSYPGIPDGNYNLHFYGVLCTGMSDKTFTVTTSTGPTDPTPVDPDPDPEEPNVTARIVYQGQTTIMNLQFTGSSKNWIINDIATYPLNSGYEWTYVIGGEIIKRNTPLSNYSYQNNNPGRIVKMQGKIGLDSFGKWIADCNQNTYYYDCAAGVFMQGNVSGAYATFIFR
jgi:hypothetical protein